VKIKLIQVGKTKDKWLQEGIDEYLKRLAAFTKLEVVEIADESLKYNANPEAVKEKEAQNIFKHLKQDDYLILLDERGQHKTSLEFSGFLVSILDKQDPVFLIGGVFGVAPSVFDRADSCLALSRFTFTHRMARLIICEQIYRAFMIKANRAYHI